MQVFVRSALSELARGFSTALVVRASVTTPVCNCSCPEFPRLPDCVCSGEIRRCPVETPCPGVDLWFCAVVGALVFLIGILVGRWSTGAVVTGRPLGVYPRFDLDEENESDLAAEALAQVNLLRNRRNGGADVSAGALRRPRGAIVA